MFSRRVANLHLALRLASMLQSSNSSKKSPEETSILVHMLGTSSERRLDFLDHASKSFDELNYLMSEHARVIADIPNSSHSRVPASKRLSLKGTVTVVEGPSVVASRFQDSL